MALNSPTIDIDPGDVLAQVGWPRPVSFAVVEGGWDTYIWRFETSDGRAHGLRVYRPGEDRDIVESARREAAALRLLAAAGLPVPALEASGAFGDRPFFILSWLPGKQLVSLMEKRMWRLWKLGFEFGRLQAKLHTIEVSDELRFAQHDDWISVIEDPPLEAAMRERSVADAFCHFDYHPLNVLAQGTRLTGLVDFSFCGVADRRADLGRTLAILVAAPIPPSPLKPALQFFRKQFAASWRRGYASEAGSFPLDPLFTAWGASTFLKDIEQAVAEGRGWGTAEDIETIRLYVAQQKLAAGLGWASSKLDLP